jgi:hypothetical protein
MPWAMKPEDSPPTGNFFLNLIKWAILIALVILAGFLAWREYDDRTKKTDADRDTNAPPIGTTRP